MVNDLVGDPAVVLKDVEVLGSNSGGDLLCNGEELGERVVRDVCELLAVELGNDELFDHACQHCSLLHDSDETDTDGVAPAERVDVQEGESLVALEELHGRDLACTRSASRLHLRRQVAQRTLDDLAEDARGRHVGCMMYCGGFLAWCGQWTHSPMLADAWWQPAGRPRASLHQPSISHQAACLLPFPCSSPPSIDFVMRRDHAACCPGATMPHPDTRHPAANTVPPHMIELHLSCHHLRVRECPQAALLVPQRALPAPTPSATRHPPGISPSTCSSLR